MEDERGYVVAAGATAPRPTLDPRLTLRVPIDRAAGCRNLEQRLLSLGTGKSAGMWNAESEDVLYVVAGRGRAVIGGTSYELEPGIGALIPPSTTYWLENAGHEPLMLVSVLSPQPGQSEPSAGGQEVGLLGHLTIQEAMQEELPAGDRRFKLLVTPRMGCRNVTQFVGIIPPGAAPFHSHTYEEVIYIVEGDGVVHIGTGDFPVAGGSSVYLPPLLEHCIENTGSTAIRLLGVFCPAGDPGAKVGEHRN